MVAHPGLDVLILALTCTVTVRAVVHWSQLPAMECPADTGQWWLPAALCAQYVPKFRLLRCSASTFNTTAVPPFAVFIPVPRRAVRYQLRGARARQWFQAFVAMHIA
jgi:hypothetical protein